MRHIATLVMAAALAAACTAPAPQPDDDQSWAGAAPAFEHLAAAGPPDTPQRDAGTVSPPSDSRPLSPDRETLRERAVGSGVEQAAAGEIVRRVETEALYVLDLTTDIDHATDTHAVVLVEVLYGTGASHPTHSRYRVTLDRSAHGWQVTGIEPVP